MDQKQAAAAVAKMNAVERAEYRYNKNKLRNDAYAAKQEQVAVEKKEKSSVKSHITITISDGTSEHTHTWDAPQLAGTVMRSQQRKDWYMQTVKDLLQKPFGRLV